MPCADVAEDYTFTVGGGGGGGGDVGGGGSDAGDGSDEGDDPAPTGVVLNYDISLIRQWTSVYFREYKHATSLADVDLSAYGERCVFVGALNTEFAADYRLGAFAPASIVNAVTPHNSPSEYNGARGGVAASAARCTRELAPRGMVLTAVGCGLDECVWCRCLVVQDRE